jgi:hypothetical protein
MAVRQARHRTVDVLVRDNRRASRGNTRDARLRAALRRQQQRERRYDCGNNEDSFHV